MIVDQDPRFVESFDPLDCSTVPVLGEGSPAIDAGDPTLEDPDGSRSDIGAFGGPEAADASTWTDGEEPPVLGDPEMGLSGGGCAVGSRASALLLGLAALRRRSARR